MIRNILEYLEQSVKKYPDKIAFSDAGSQVSYQDLIAKAKAVGTCVADRLSGATNQPVVIFVDRTLHSLILFFGTVYSGNFYIPIDVKMPRHRIEAMLRALEPKLILSHCADVKVTTELGFASQAVTFMDAVSCTPDETKLANIRARSIDSDPLCVYYTSGSSGMPKGAILSHRSVIEMTEQFSSVFSFSDECIFGNQAAFDFSVSLKDIFSTLKHGAALHILPTELFTFPVRLIQCLNDKKINTAIWVTSAMRVIANLNGLDHTLPLYLQKMLFSGELMPVKVLNYWRKYLPHVQYVNLYGQSEIAYNCSYYIVDRRLENHEPLPAGNTFSNIDVFLLDGQGKPAGEGQVGEIYIRGACLALGYFNNPAETSRAFCQNPLNPHYPEKVYRTGDLGKFNDRGELIVLSRKDNQIKHMGHRIELGEIEIAANALAFLDAACCLYDSEREKLVLFYQAPCKCDLEILAGLKEYLPKYMLPNKLMYFEQLPLNKNAKIDRKKLKEMI